MVHGTGAVYFDLALIFRLLRFSLLIRFFLHFALIFQASLLRRGSGPNVHGCNAMRNLARRQPHTEDTTIECEAQD